MLERKWYVPLSMAVLVHLLFLGIVITAFSSPQQSEPEYMEVTLSELFSPPGPVGAPADEPQQQSAPDASSRPAANKPTENKPTANQPPANKATVNKPPADMPVGNKSAENQSVSGQSSVQPLIAAGTAAEGDIAGAPANPGSGTGNDVSASGGQAGSGGQAASGEGAGSYKPPGPTRTPRVVASEEPDYPDAARQNGWQGTARIRVLISERGMVEDVRISESTGYDVLDEAALASMRRWQFSPALKEGRPVAAWVRIPVTFRLQ